MANNIMAIKLMLSVEAGKTSQVISFYKAAFGAEEVGSTMHGLPELNICGHSFLIEDSAQGPAGGNGPITPALKMEDVAAAVAKAVSAGAVEVEIQDWEARLNGCPMGKVRDPYGFVWHIIDRSFQIPIFKK